LLACSNASILFLFVALSASHWAISLPKSPPINDGLFLLNSFLNLIASHELGDSALIAAQQTQSSLTRLSNAWDRFKNSFFDADLVKTGSTVIATILDA
jgi:hypothetical protein